jgi:hypothetical protein
MRRPKLTADPSGGVAVCAPDCVAVGNAVLAVNLSFRDFFPILLWGGVLPTSAAI